MNYLQVIELLKNISSNNAFINSVYFTNMKDFASIEDKKYFTINYDFQNLQMQNFQNNNSALYIYTFSVAVADIVKEGAKETEDIAINNSIDIAKDLITVLNQTDNVATNDLVLNPFTDETNDIISGITFQLQIQTMTYLNICTTPLINK